MDIQESGRDGPGPGSFRSLFNQRCEVLLGVCQWPVDLDCNPMREKAAAFTEVTA